MKKPKWLTKEVKKVLIVEAVVIILVLIAGIALLVMHENRRHGSMHSSMSSLRQALEKEDVQTSDIETKCKKSGKGLSSYSWHKCTMHLEYGPVAMDAREANTVIELVNKIITENANFSKYDYFDRMDPVSESGCAYISCGISLYQKDTERRCSMSYNYTNVAHSDYKSLNMYMVCDDDSWFNKTFRN